MIFSTGEAVLKVMSEFRRDGLIEVRNRKIFIGPRLARAFRRSPQRVPAGAR